MRKIEDWGCLAWFDSNLIRVDLSRSPKLTFTDASSTGFESTAKAYKYFAEPGYLHNIKGKCMVNKFGISIWKVSWTLLSFSPLMLRKYRRLVFSEFAKSGNFCIHMKNLWCWSLIFYLAPRIYVFKLN